MKHTFPIVLTLVILWCRPVLAEDSGTTVLVTNASTPVSSLSHKELRILFLGLPVTRENRRLIPLLNRSNKHTYQAFLQKVVFMSERSYQRQLLAQVFRHGGQRPQLFNNQQRLLEALRSEPDFITFMKIDEARKFPELQQVQQLW